MSRLMRQLSIWSTAFSIRTKIMGLAAGMVVLMGVSAALLAQSGFIRATSAELERRGISIAADVAARGADMILTGNVLGMHELLRDTVTNNEDVRYVILLDARERVVSHTFGRAFPRDLLNLPVPAGGKEPAIHLLSTETGMLHDIALPILGGSAGTVRIGMSPERLRREAVRLTEWLVFTVLAMAAVALAGAYGLTNLLTRPILGLVQVAEETASGDLRHRAPPGPPDEIGLLIATFSEMLDRLSDSQTVKQELLNRVFTAQEDERRRLARELHDETSQAITSLIVGLRALEEEHPKVHQRSAEMRALAAQTLEEIHNLILELRPRVLDELGLIPALRQYTADFDRKHGIKTEFQVVGYEVRLPVQVETCLYRIVQEALTNVARHSGAANASVVLTLSPDLATVVVEDDGHGFVADSVTDLRSLGLVGMKERAFLVNGSLDIESSETGTSVFAKIPLVPWRKGEADEPPHFVGG